MLSNSIPRTAKTSSPLDGRRKKVRVACERCRMKKTRCDGRLPCQRCKGDALVCTAGSRMKARSRELPRGYAETLENTQRALIATVQKLYTMVRTGETWDLGEPELNSYGVPVINDIAKKLGCLRPSLDMLCASPQVLEGSTELHAHSISYMGQAESAFSSTSEQAVNDYRQVRHEQQAQPQQHDILLACYQNESRDICSQFCGQPLYQNKYSTSSIPIASFVYSDFQWLSHVGSPVPGIQNSFPTWSDAEAEFLPDSAINLCCQHVL